MEDTAGMSCASEPGACASAPAAQSSKAGSPIVALNRMDGLEVLKIRTVR
jgi:hypothetical protein